LESFVLLVLLICAAGPWPANAEPADEAQLIAVLQSAATSVEKVESVMMANGYPVGRSVMQ